jgi:superfamily II DNA or RNA helicase
MEPSASMNHSELGKNELIESFKNSKRSVLVCVKALDEGLNVKDVNIGIVLGYNKTARQAVQRMGRIVRKNEKGTSTLYNFYYRNTSDFFSAKNFSENFEESRVYWK